MAHLKTYLLLTIAHIRLTALHKLKVVTQLLRFDAPLPILKITVFPLDGT